MKPKTILTAVLLTFVVASAAYFVFTETTREKRPAHLAEESRADPSATTTTDAGSKLVVYYFHATRRCWTCKTIEAFSEEAIRTGFAEQLESGEMEWRTVNIDKPENRHFVDDFQLATRTVVLVRVVDGVNKEWKRLDRVWELVRDKPAFVDYIWDNTNEFLADAHG
jgi:hypothetical protein